MGAENRAPPGIGSNPIRAVITEPTVRASFERRVKVSTNLSKCPDSFIILLITSMSQTTKTRLMVCKWARLLIALWIQRTGPSPIQNPRTNDPTKRDRLSCKLNLFSIKIRLNTINIFTRAGIGGISF